MQGIPSDGLAAEQFNKAQKGTIVFRFFKVVCQGKKCLFEVEVEELLAIRSCTVTFPPESQLQPERVWV